MSSPVLASTAYGAIDLNQPGTYLHWSIFTVSVANLVLIGVMVVIFGAALLFPFPKSRTFAPEPAADPATGDPSASRARFTAGDGARDGDGTRPAADLGSDEDRAMWTNKARRLALRLLPPGKLLPDRQPAYVASWVYVFGVASLAALGMAIATGFALALGGPDWWHYNSMGHFFNSLHLWSVELFMALIVIHLWGKFWMAAWRGRRAMTWITGGVAFLASVVECFTGYLSQQNFDSQWISASAKDAFNSAGIGSIWNAMNFGQMLMWHIVLVPLGLIAIVGAHILLVRVRGVSHPLPRPGTYRGSWRQRRRAQAADDAAPWRGRTRRYDILKEGTAAAGIILVLTIALGWILGSPDVPPATVQSWARVAPADFLATAATELNGTSLSAQYGPPYNNGTASVQRLWFSPQEWAGVTQPINGAQAFVLSPLAKLAPTNPALRTALATYNGAPAAQRMSWVNAYGKAVTKVKFVNGTPVIPAGAYGPVLTMLNAELTMARSGGLDTDLLAQRQFYGTNYTKPLLFMGDGQYFANQADAMHLSGDQWGVMNETGSYPGQPWLWLYDLWYSVPGFSSSANVDLIAIYMTGAATILLLAVPFVPGLRDIPRWIPVHRLIWRRPEAAAAGGATGPQPGPGESGSTGPSGRQPHDVGSRH